MAMDLNEYTIGADAKAVTVGEFRSLIAHLEQVTSDYHSCVGDVERGRWNDRVRLVGCELIYATCKRATAADWTRRESAIERSTKLLSR
jgi:hypothetical protein